MALLTKSKFKMALECPTKLWYFDRPDEYINKLDENSFLKALAEGGAQVEALARQYFPDGLSIVSSDTKEALEKTQELLQRILSPYLKPLFNIKTISYALIFFRKNQAISK